MFRSDEFQWFFLAGPISDISSRDTCSTTCTGKLKQFIFSKFKFQNYAVFFERIPQKRQN